MAVERDGCLARQSGHTFWNSEMNPRICDWNTTSESEINLLSSSLRFQVFISPIDRLFSQNDNDACVANFEPSFAIGLTFPSRNCPVRGRDNFLTERRPRRYRHSGVAACPVEAVRCRI
jgi:hypothetical protein